MDWQQILAEKERWIGGDIETVENGTPYRGPLESMELDGSMMRFTSTWCAKLEGGAWTKWDGNSSAINVDEVQPQDIGGGRIFFTMPMLGYCTIFPKDGSKLNPTKVKGLEIEEAPVST